MNNALCLNSLPSNSNPTFLKKRKGHHSSLLILWEGADVYIIKTCLTATDPSTAQERTEEEALKAAGSKHDKFTSKNKYLFHLMRKKNVFLSVLHSMKQRISHPLKRTPGSSASGDWRCRNSSFFFWPLQPLPLLVLAKNIHQGFWYPSIPTAWLALGPHHPWAPGMSCRDPPSTERAAVPFLPTAHHCRLAGRHCRLSRRA